MNVPMSWLREYVDINCDTKTFVEKITMSGSKVEAVEYMGAELSNIAVGKIEKIVKHPDADKLVVTTVDIGERKIQIVTGATNVFEGAYVPVALDGAVLAGGKTIKTGSLRGQLSEGMMCSVEELGYERSSYPEAPEDGIYIFSGTPDLGADVIPILQLREDVVEYEITSNRPDCFSVIGIAREAAATFDTELKMPEITLKETAGGTASDYIAVEIKNPKLCPRYAAKVVKNVKIEPSPQWMRQRITAAGLRPINNIVDITNYVMLELGQPMHAFDIDTISGSKIIVRNAQDGEKFITLDKSEHVLDSSMLVIADTEKAVAIAGVMGGENSKVTGFAEAVLFESANFDGTNIRLTSKKLGMRTDASGKFEKGIDPNLAETAVNRAVQLVEILGAGEVVPGIVDCYPRPRTEHTVPYNPEKINRLLGTDISEKDMLRYFSLLGIKTNETEKTVTIPTFRPDLQTLADLTEEVGRLYGYDKIPITLPVGEPTAGKKTYEQSVIDNLKTVCTSLGLNEMLCYSFESPKVFDKLNFGPSNPYRNAVQILNPLGEDFSIMRTSSLNYMFTSLSTNYNRRNEEAALFEVANVFTPKSVPVTELPDESLTLTIGLYGKKDFYDIKGIVSQIFGAFFMSDVIEYIPNTSLEHMHPYRTANIVINNKNIGYLGEVHPMVLDNYSINTKTYIAVIQVSAIIENAKPINDYKPLPKYPSISRDIAVIADEEIPVKYIEKLIKSSGGSLVTSVTLFDVYKGAQIKENCRSIAFKITFRSDTGTLTDADVDMPMSNIIEALKTKFNAQLRDK